MNKLMCSTCMYACEYVDIHSCEGQRAISHVFLNCPLLYLLRLGTLIKPSAYQLARMAD